MTPNPKNMSSEALLDAIIGHSTELPPDSRTWLRAYAHELFRRASTFERNFIMLILSHAS